MERREESKKIYLRALSILEQSLGPEHPRVGTTLNNLGELFRTRNSLGNDVYDIRSGEAEPYYKRAIAIREKALGNQHPDLGLTLLNLAGLYRAQVKYHEARSILRRAISIFEKSLGKEHPHLATGQNNLAGIYLLEGDYRRAEPLFKNALRIREATFGPDHRLVAAIVNSLAHVYRGMGNGARAERMQERYQTIADRQSTLEVPGGRIQQRLTISSW